MKAVALWILFLFLGTLHATGQDNFSTDELFGEEYEGTESPVGVAPFPTEDEGKRVLISPEELQTTRSYEANPVSLKKFNEAEWREIVGDVTYQEERKKNQPTAIAWNSSVLKLVAYTLVIGAVVWLLYYITKHTYFDLKIKRTELQSGEFDNQVENIEDIDIDQLLEQARREGNSKVSVRLYFLGLLKKLNAAGMISWKKDKTNRDYLSELFLKDFHYEEIRRLTTSYEAVWYGEHALQPQSFHLLTAQFEKMYQKINRTETA